MSSIPNRKKDHVVLTAGEDVAYTQSTGLERYHFLHNALPEVNFDQVSTESSLLGHSFSMPFFISSMTGGYADGTAINQMLASICNDMNLPMGVGSQRAMIEDQSQTDSFSIVRKTAPNAFIAANIGGCQLIESNIKENLDIAIDSIQADALIIHLNPLQELMQPEGDRKFAGILEAIHTTVEVFDIPVIVKETGAGLSLSVIDKLSEAGVKVIDIAGAGGTSWSKVENKRQISSQNNLDIFNDWGIPLAHILEQLPSEEQRSYKIIASGGIRTSLDILASLCLGADLAASATPLIKHLVNGGEASARKWLQDIQHQLKIGMCLLGVTSPNQLARKHLHKV